MCISDPAISARVRISRLFYIKRIFLFRGSLAWTPEWGFLAVPGVVLNTGSEGSKPSLVWDGVVHRLTLYALIPRFILQRRYSTDRANYVL